MVVIGPKASEQEATDFGYATLDAQFTVVELPTRDRARATSIIKAKKLAETGNLGDSLRFARHQWPPSTQPTTEAEPDSDMEGS